MGPGMCQTTGFLLTFLGMASINNLVAISIYRYLVISYAKVWDVLFGNSWFDNSNLRTTSWPTAGKWWLA